MIDDLVVVEAVDLSRTYRARSDPRPALDGVSLRVRAGEVVAVMGPSGSGKSTLLALLGGLDVPDRGTVRIAGTDWRRLAERPRFYRRTCGFIAQGLALLAQATATENVELPLLLDGGDAEERARRVAAALARVGLANHARKLPDQLSGGEQQRVSIARALVHEPVVVLADEPTASLDSVTAASITELLVAAARERGAAVVLVTHDPVVAGYADRIVTLHSGRVTSDVAVTPGSQEGAGMTAATRRVDR
jgi:putative ABC transport system ATP-binding protein